MKIVINADHGGFRLSDEAMTRYLKAKNISLDADPHRGRLYDWEIPRDDLDLIAIVEEMGRDASSVYASLKIVDIPDDVEWQIEEYDGLEWVAEKHRTWD